MSDNIIKFPTPMRSPELGDVVRVDEECPHTAAATGMRMWLSYIERNRMLEWAEGVLLHALNSVRMKIHVSVLSRSGKR